MPKVLPLTLHMLHDSLPHPPPQEIGLDPGQGSSSISMGGLEILSPKGRSQNHLHALQQSQEGQHFFNAFPANYVESIKRVLRQQG